MDTYVVIGTLFGISESQLHAIRSSIGRPVSILIDDQRGQEANPKGFPKAYEVLINAAIADPNCKYVWIIGDDTMPKDDCLAKTQAVIEADLTIGAIFPVEAWFEDGYIATVLPFLGTLCSIEDALEDDFVPQIFPGMACACIRREAWQAIGARFDHSLGRGYCEDTAVGIEMWRTGFRVVNYRGAWFLHERGRTYNRLVAEGHYRKEEPYEAAERLKLKYPFMWRDSADQIMERLKGWYQLASRNLGQS